MSEFHHPVGTDILRNNAHHEIYAPGRDVLDLELKDTVESVIRDLKPSVVINTAAFHNVTLCEIEYTKAFKINCAAVRDLATICRQVGTWFVTFSTDYVFDGNK